MKIARLIISAVFTTAMMLTSYSQGASNEELSSNLVTIGNQIWMSENLNIDTFRNADSIPHAKTYEEWVNAGVNYQPAWCYYDNDPSNGEKYGRIYNWYAVHDARGLAPEGYHVPSDEEWTILMDHLGGQPTAGAKMKSTSGWEDGWERGKGTNESGFSGLPGGNCSSYYQFSFIGSAGGWWSSTEHSTHEAGLCFVSYLDGNASWFEQPKAYGFSVRCLRD